MNINEAINEARNIKKVKVSQLDKLIGDPKAEKEILAVIADEKKKLERWKDSEVLADMVGGDIKVCENILRIVRKGK